jgi:uncharacterized repeat protein (TIGR03803 family)
MSVIRWKNEFAGAVETGPSGAPEASQFNAGGIGNAAPPGSAVVTTRPQLTTLANFNNASGKHPYGGLIADAAGDLFGTTASNGSGRDGTVFEIAKTEDGYAGTPTVLVDFTGADGSVPLDSLITDAAGDLFGATDEGGTTNDGTVFELAKTRHGYAGKPTTLVSFTGADGANPQASLITDAAGDLFGTTSGGGTDGYGTVFEIAKTQNGYASTPTTLVSFVDADANPIGGLVADAAGDLFGTTGGTSDQPGNDGTVFEIVKTKNGYAKTPTILVSFTVADGLFPTDGLIIDAAGDLFGTTQYGGADDDGTVFELARTKGGYASAPTTLVSFTGDDGAQPVAGLIADAAGNLFGTTDTGGAKDDGTVFEIAKVGSGYASAPTILANFKGGNGASPAAGLIADAAGDLLGTTVKGGVKSGGTVFEITDSGFVPPAAPLTPSGTQVTRSPPPGAAFVQAMAGHGPIGSEAAGAAIPVSRSEASARLALPCVA